MEKLVVMFNVYGRMGIGTGSIVNVPDNRWSIAHIVEWAKANKTLQGVNGMYYAFAVAIGSIKDFHFVTQSISFDGKPFKSLIAGPVKNVFGKKQWYLCKSLMTDEDCREMATWEQGLYLPTKKQLVSWLKERSKATPEQIREFNKYGKIVIA